MLPLEEVQDKVNKQFFGKGLVGIIEFYDYNNAEGDFLLHISKVESLLHSCLRNHDLLTQISDTQALVLLLDTDPRLAPVLANRVDTSARNKGFKVKGAFQSFSAGFDRLAVFNKVTGDLAQQMASVKLNEFLFK